MLHTLTSFGVTQYDADGKSTTQMHDPEMIGTIQMHTKINVVIQTVLR